MGWKAVIDFQKYFGDANTVVHKIMLYVAHATDILHNYNCSYTSPTCKPTSERLPEFKIKNIPVDDMKAYVEIG